MNRIFIVAGNAKQARAWASEGHLNKKDYVIVNSPHDLRDLNNILVAYVGSYYLRKDLHDIRLYVDVANRTNTQA